MGPKRKKKLDEAVAAAQDRAIQDVIASTNAPPASTNAPPASKNKRKRKKDKNKRPKKNKKGPKKNKKGPKKKNKIQLGGVRTSAPVTKPEPLQWWQVCVCVYLRVA